MRKRTIAVVLVCSIAIMLPASAAAQTAPTFVGVRTFLSAPYEPDLDKLHADFAVLACHSMKVPGDSPENATARATCVKTPRE